MDTILDIKNLSIAFSNTNEGIKAVNRASLQLRTGEVLGIVGESGCGKTTLSRSVLGLLPPAGKILEGELVFEGKDLLHLSKEEKRKIRGREIGMIFQDSMTSLNPVRKIGSQFIETLSSRLEIHEEQARQIAEEMLAKVNLPNPKKIMNRYSFQLSGGMRQRVMIAIALALRPKILIADEPTTALDVTVQAQILKEMRDLKENYGTSIMLVSHNLGVVYQVADTIAVMYAGSVVEYGDASTIFKNPTHPYTKALLGSIPTLSQHQEKLVSIEGTPPVSNSLPSGCVFHPRCQYASHLCRLEKPITVETVEGVRVACHRVNSSNYTEGEDYIA
ncbi:ABC transporter ATP-binding protein [Natronincola ferrireducens]|uniref:Peptide/nickel transport system ATP-binding protein n=1 Tax=Natronincola ferrireducens TaxID=393762 RepID=A0A1G9GL83_9FIRM|nr:ABC transporter ATP-binding protein [Natronincola ferrireducens]SDL01023.1 peptide/nickel transport system ATP-binding protein [Natronincola ferrireducens]